METVAVIGNGPAIFDKEVGELIDQHDIVVRFNCYQTADYENHIGSKTTIWVVNLANDTWKVLNNRVNFQELDHFMIVESPGSKYLPRFNAVKSLITINYRKPYKILHKSFYKSVGRKLNTTKIPSTGTMAIYQLLQHYDKISLYGFNILSDTSPTHYYGGPSNIRTAHSIKQEAIYINKQIEAGAIELL